MATVLAEIQVLFSGIWRPSPRTTKEAIQKQISVQFLSKKSLNATYQFCTDGLRLLVMHDNGKQGPKLEKIPVAGIQDISANIYSGTCLMTIYVDNERRLNYLVCRCESERDAGHVVLTFKEHKKSLIGEGYKIDLVKPQGRNWTLMPKHENMMNGHSEISSDSVDYHASVSQQSSVGDNAAQSNGTDSAHHVKIEMATETFEREPCDIEGKQGFSIAVQTDFGEADSDRDSMMSSLSYKSLKDELLQLSQEIREIKFLLETTTGVSAVEYFKRDVNANTIQNRALIPVPIDGQDLPSPTDGVDRHVNFADSAVDLPDHDIRSFGVQTVKDARKGYYVKRQGRSDGRSLPGRGTQRIRSSSTNSPRSPSSLGRAGGRDVFEYPSPNGKVYIRGTDPHAMMGHSSTIERPIEQVYHSYSKNFRSHRNKVIVMPGSHGTMPILRRSQGGSKSSVTDHSDLSTH